MRFVWFLLFVLFLSSLVSAFPFAPVDGDTVNFRNPFFSFPHDSVVCGNGNCVRVCPEAFCIIDAETNLVEK